MKVGSIEVNFYKIPLIKLTKYFTAYQGFQMKMIKGLDIKTLDDKQLDKEMSVDEMIELATKAFDIVNQPFYDGMKQTFFENIMLVDYGHASDPAAFEKALEVEGLGFEFVLMTEAVKHYMGKSLAKIGEEGKLIQSETMDTETTQI